MQTIRDNIIIDNMRLLIEEKIREKGLSRKEVALAIGISQSHLSNVINGVRGCDTDLLSKIADGLGVSVTSLIEDEKSKVVSTFRDGNETFEIRKIQG